MTATTISTQRATTLEPGFGAALRSEWIKLRSIRSTWIIVLLGITLSIGFSALVATITGATWDSAGDELFTFDPVLTTNSGSLFGCILLISLGVTAVSAEYSSGMIRTTFINNPRRGQVFAAKTIVVALLGLLITCISIPGMFLVSQPIYAHYGLETASILDGTTIRPLLAIIITQVTNYALIPFAIAWMLRSAASAIAISLGFMWLPWMIGPIVPEVVQANVLRFLPDVAANSISGITTIDSPQYLSTAPAIIVVAAWLIGSLAVAAITLLRRDV